MQPSCRNHSQSSCIMHPVSPIVNPAWLTYCGTSVTSETSAWCIAIPKHNYLDWSSDSLQEQYPFLTTSHLQLVSWQFLFNFETGSHPVSLAGNLCCKGFMQQLVLILFNDHSLGLQKHLLHPCFPRGTISTYDYRSLSHGWKQTRRTHVLNILLLWKIPWKRI